MNYRWAAFYAIAAAGCFFLSAASSRAEDSCPAIARQDAAAALSAEPESITLSVAYRGSGNYTCRFAAGDATLSIIVAPYHFQDGWESYTRRCSGPTVAVPGIGNEAVQCNTESKDGPAELMAHAVDTFFEIKLSRGPAAQGTTEALRRAARSVANTVR